MGSPECTQRSCLVDVFVSIWVSTVVATIARVGKAAGIWGTIGAIGVGGAIDASIGVASVSGVGEWGTVAVGAHDSGGGGIGGDNTSTTGSSNGQKASEHELHGTKRKVKNKKFRTLYHTKEQKPSYSNE
uniref:Uncharacterized protein n=1 Tax=Lutzomyia longipalpis TaxID=7200 RepID=A0A1B0GGV2_LUTLO